MDSDKLSFIFWEQTVKPLQTWAGNMESGTKKMLFLLMFTLKFLLLILAEVFVGLSYQELWI